MESVAQLAAQQARQRWPHISLQLGAFESIADEALSAGGSLDHLTDLYLAQACAQGDVAAIDHFEREYVSAVPGFVARLALNSAQVDEVKQSLRVNLLIGTPPRISTFRATGPLGGWVRICAVRLAVRSQHALHRLEHPATPEQLERLAGDAVNMAPLLERHREQVVRIFKLTLEGLPDMEKTAVRMHLLDGASIDAIGRVFGVHRATAARWLVASRRRILDEIRRQLSLSLGASSAEVGSLLAFFARDLDLSLTRVLATQK